MDSFQPYDLPKFSTVQNKICKYIYVHMVQTKNCTLAVDVEFQPLELCGEITASSETLDFESSFSSGGR